ncbi:MAG TPA: alpha/beta fold hydrolase [Anaerolineae bacterium]|nr:alpha/beta fold hydrolase [Anaerolineae bacterium]
MDSTTGFFNGLYYEVAGEGHPLVLIHGGLVNSGLWDDQFEVFARQYRTLRYDVRGFGKSLAPTAYFSNHGDLRDLLDFLGFRRACVLGLSMGGSIAIDFTLTYPDRAAALLPVASGLSGYRTTTNPALRDEMNAAYERGDKERAVELSLQMWTDGPQRKPDQVDPAVRERVRVMTIHTFDLPDVEQWLQHLEPPALDRLAEIHVPTLFIVGDQDVEDILKIGDLIVTHVPGARRAIIPGTAHHLNVERPEEFNRSVLDFLKSLSL